MPVGESADRVTTRERINEVFKRYNDKEQKKSKKKSSEPQEHIVLQTVKKDLNLVKDTDHDESILQNTYDPIPSSPRYTKNKRRENEITEKSNNSKNTEDVQSLKRRSHRDLPPLPSRGDISTYVEKDTDVSKTEDDENVGTGKKSKGKSKKGRRKEEAGVQGVDGEDTLLQEYQQQMVQVEEKSLKKVPEEEPSSLKLNNDVGKKKKKKLKSVNAESDVGDEEEAARLESEGRNETESQRKKKKKKSKHMVKEETEEEPEASERPAFDDSLVLGVYIHRTDRLRTDLMISHPMVKIHVVDESTGQYVKKEDCHRPVASFYEQENLEHILPIMTQPFDFKKKKSIIPEWQEQIIFNERFGYFIQQEVLLFFEILDFVTMEEARTNVDVDIHERGFRKIAWAFLKLVGTNGVLNIESKVRLQLFCPPHHAKKESRRVEVVEWWSKHPRVKYASTLYVTVKGIKLPQHVDPCMRSMMALQEERGSTSYSDLQNEVTKRSLNQPSESKAPVIRWSRLPGQVCRIPNKAVLAFRGGMMGCFTVLFSHAGTMLAAACADRDAFPVVVYDIPSGMVVAAFNGHFKIVYDLCWSRDDRSLLSASSDGTVREWDIERLTSTAQKVLPHPCFVYCAQYHPTANNLVVTGGYDGLLRLWRLDVNHVNGEMLQGFEGHHTFINSICFNCEGSRMFSADNEGLILVWKTCVDDRKQQQQQQQQQPWGLWCVEKRIDEKDLRSIPINMLQLHPNGRSLLIHAKDSVVRMMDLRILVVKKYSGATNYRERIYSTFTPCGTFIFSGSEDGMAYVWNTDTGDHVAVYSELCYPTSLHGVAFHPYENMVAFCSFGQSQPIHVYVYDRKVSQMEMQSLRTSSRCVSADPKSVRNTPDTLGTLDTPTPSAPSAMDHFAQTTRLAMRMQCVKEQLDSVLEPRHHSTSGFLHEPDKGHTGTGFTTDTNTGLDSSFPSSFSKLQLSGSLTEHFIPQAALTGKHRGFSPVGQRLRGSSFRLYRTPDSASSGLHMDPNSASSGLHMDPNSASSGLLMDPNSASVHQTVVALYDYKANRCDELSIRRGDVIHVLYKDNHSWWFGCLLNGLQGYFLSSYVVDQSDFNKEASPSAETHTVHVQEETVDRVTPTRVSAAVSSSGDLCFLSEPTLSDTEPEFCSSTRRKKKVKKAGVLTSSTSSSRRRGASTTMTPRPLPKRPIGRYNSAFESDT